MTPGEFEAFAEYSVEFNASQTIAAEGLGGEEAEATRRMMVERGMPAGRDTPGHQFLSIMREDDAQPIGSVWFSVDPVRLRAFVGDIVVRPELRLRGYGAETIRLVAERSRALGCLRLALEHSLPVMSCRG